MKLVFLGTSAAQPTTERGMTCICLVLDKEILMFDAGEGAQIAFQKAKLGWNKKIRIFVTHLHGDHCVGILGLLQTMSLQNRTESVDIYGPRGIEEFIAANLKVLNFGLTFPVRITRISEGLVLDDSGYNIHTCEAEHSIPAYSYRFTENDRPGRFYPEKAKELGIPEGKLWHELQNDKEITVQGRTIRPSDVMGEKRKGIKIGISGDTRPTRKLEEFFKGCDYMTFDSTYDDSLKDKAKENYHSTSKEAAELAKKAGVTNLILTHFSARYENTDELVREAKTIHESVVGARDLLEINIR
ncbi:Ribonuclease Z [Nitrosotalea sinensis]|jgi:ribonuclease Z|uniref:Ribonuclease Z n=1 Tax=Nitrosotalea sinensis TaxID=1499975 RepID=A0A2H1EF51_9ARCH|nr:ribonuclease Z [Candidatus Nitrosotalea sinensis]SHO43432.1 Ribonuclease Z [Candidatus Nitrosotalea sinensis]